MIAKAKSTSNLRLFEYLMGHGKDDELICSNYVVGERPQDLLREMQAFYGAKNLKNPLLHIILSFDRQDSQKDIPSIVRQFAERLGIKDEYQYVGITHSELFSTKRGIHCHLVVNRVSTSYAVFNDKMIGLKVRDIARKMNVELGLRNEYDRSQRRRFAYCRQQEESVARTNALGDLREIAVAIRVHSSNVDEYFKSFSGFGVSIQPVFSDRNQRFVGHRYHYKGYAFKASEIDRGLSLKRLKEHFAERAPKRTPLCNRPAKQTKQPDLSMSVLLQQLVASNAYRGEDEDEEELKKEHEHKR